MNYWKGLMIAVAIDLGWIMGGPSVMGPEPLPPRDFAVAWSDVPLVRPTVGRPDIEQLNANSDLEDSLMTELQEHPENVTAMEKLAELYMQSAGYDAAIDPLARALQLEPTRRSLWVALDKALEQSGYQAISDEELTIRAQKFIEAVEMYGHGC